MEHNDAVRLQAVEKYILGELSHDVRDEFEAHYFDCAVCSFNLRAGVAFAAGARQFFTDAPVPSAVSRPAPSGWFAWLKPAFAVPVFAALLLVIGYQGLKISHTSTVSNIEVDAPPSFLLTSAHASANRIQVRPGQTLDLRFDVTVSPAHPNSIFVAFLRNAAGNNLASLRISRVRAKNTVIFRMPGGLPEGDYKLVVVEQANGNTYPAGDDLSFAVAFSSQNQQD